ncbi:MAG: biopolymer transporter ExbD [Planctomycetota bacterium]
MSMGPGAALGRKSKHRGLMSEINVTPLVDVMLVLVVIFMITAPTLKESIDVDLPKVGGALGTSRGSTPFTVGIDEKGYVHAAGTFMKPAEVPGGLPPLLKGHEKEVVTLKAHRSLHYDSVVKVIAVMRGAGVTAISIAVDRE